MPRFGLVVESQSKVAPGRPPPRAALEQGVKDTKAVDALVEFYQRIG